MWSCPRCNPWKKRILREKANKLFARKTCYFLTLTFSNQRSAEDAWNTVGQRWNQLMSYCRRKYGSFSFIRFVERHRDRPYPHIHVILDKWMFTRDFWMAATSAGFGNIAHVERASGEGAANYASKYASKAADVNIDDAGRKAAKVRIVSMSRNAGAMHPRGGSEQLSSLTTNRGGAIIAVLCSFSRLVKESNFPLHLHVGKYRIRSTLDDEPSQQKLLSCELKRMALPFGWGEYYLPVPTYQTIAALS